MPFGIAMIDCEWAYLGSSGKEMSVYNACGGIRIEN